MSRALGVLALATVVVPPTLAAGPAVEIIAHRGASHDAPENTLAAISLAWTQGADAAEFDVFLSKDGKIVVIHDKDTKRVAGVDKRVVDQSLDELRALDVGAWKDARFRGERIPTLAEALDTVPAGKRVFIEVKCGPEIVPELERQLAAARLEPGQIAVISFSAPVIAAVKAALPHIHGYWVVSLGSGKKKPAKVWTAEELVRTAVAIRADGLDLSADEHIDADFVRTINAARLPVYVWTVNDVALARRMIAAGVVGITTDRPGWLRAELAK